LLYAGIVGDTGRFLYPATSRATFAIASQLLNYDFSASDISRQLMQVPFNIAQLFGYVYQNIQADENGAGHVYLTKEVLDKFGCDDSQTGHVVSLPGQIDSLLCWAIFVEQPEGHFRVRIRSKGPVINVVAKRHHGGGHPLASGANAKDLAECQAIYEELQQVAREYRGQA
jgi:phosphoesterase RecJ-like protein